MKWLVRLGCINLLLFCLILTLPFAIWGAFDLYMLAADEIGELIHYLKDTQKQYHRAIP